MVNITIIFKHNGYYFNIWIDGMVGQCYSKRKQGGGYEASSHPASHSSPYLYDNHRKLRQRNRSRKLTG